MPKELKNRKTGVVHFLSDEDFDKVKKLGLLKKFTWREVEPIKKIIPTLKILEVVEVKKKRKKND